MPIRKIIFLLTGLFCISFVYSQTYGAKRFKHISRLKVVNRNLPARINESSGLIFFRNKLWTMNDSGDVPFIFGLDTLGQNIRQIITIRNGRNIDWEEIAQDDNYIFVGDFGNNFGLRNKMVIYRIDKNAIPDTGNYSVDADSIIFSYRNKPLPGKKLERSSYDCEAMVPFHDTLVLFSKNWKGTNCNIYILPAIPGTYELSPVQTIIPDGLITGASLSPDKTKVLLVGYKDYCPFVYLLNKFNLQKISLKKAVHRYYSAKLAFQTEGITFSSQNEAYISCELNKLRPNTLFKVHFW